MKIDYFVELNGEQHEIKRLSDIVKEIWKSEGNLLKDLTSIEVYFKPEEKMCYYVLNGDSKGQFEI
ncbi:MAG: DUF6465 family protein [Defluviitaleaceae bacterium]|nr:DUF6465 family protein [Defluviitaleaceae bacterium]